MQIKFISILQSASKLRNENPQLSLVKYESALENIWNELTDEEKWTIIELTLAIAERKI